MANVKMAVIGIGKMGLLHASILNTMPNVEIVALCDKSRLLLKIAKRLFKTVKIVNEISKLNDLCINSVYVTTPIPSHFGIIKNLLSNPQVQNIFVEKTLASSWDMAKELCEITKNFQGTMMVGYMKRFSTTFRKAKSILAQEVLGKVVSFDAYAFSSDFSEIQKRSKKTTMRGGVLRDLGSHVIDLAIWFFGDFKVVSASMKSIVNEDSEDSVNFIVSNSSLVGKFDISWCIDKYRMPSFGITVKGNKGTMKVDDYSLSLNLNDGKDLRWFRHDLDDAVNFLLGDPEYYREDEAFVKSVLSGRKIEPSFNTALKTEYIIDNIKREAKVDS